MSDHQSVILTAPVDAASREESPPLIFGLEEAILGTLLIEGRIPEGIREQLSPDIFSERWRPIARAILSVAEGSGACDVVSVYHELERVNHGGLEMNQTLGYLGMAVPNSANLEKHIELLRKEAEEGRVDDDSILARSGLSRLRPGDGLEVVEQALRRVAYLLKGADPLRCATVREAAIAKLEELKVRSPARLVDAILVTNPDRADDMAGRPIALADPEPWPEPVDGVMLLNEIKETVRRFVAVPQEVANAVSLWCVHTHAIDEAQTSPIMAIISPAKRCGKTLLLELTNRFVRRPLTAASITPAALFRTIEAYSPTLLIDEGDSFLEKSDELRGVLNSGHTRGTAFVLRVVGDQHEPRTFSTWCPKAIALIGRLPPTLEDRSIPIPMRRRARTEQLERFRRDRTGGALEVPRQKIGRWVADHREALRDADPDLPEVLNDRAGDNWRPLLAIADAAGGPWPKCARAAAIALSGAIDEADGTPAIQLLADVGDLFAAKGADRMTSSEVVEALGKMEDRPWPEWRRGRPINARQLARLLAPFGITPRTLRFGGDTAKGYAFDDLRDPLSRYSSSAPCQSVTPSQPPSDAAKIEICDPSHDGVVTDRDGVLSERRHCNVTDVTDRNALLPVGLPSAKDLDRLESEFRACWRAIPPQNKFIARETWPSDLEQFCRERGLCERVFACLEPGCRDLLKGRRRRSRPEARAELGSPGPLFEA